MEVVNNPGRHSLGLPGTTGVTPATATTEPIDLLLRLADADSPREIAAEIAQRVRTGAGCRLAEVVWGFDGVQPSASLVASAAPAGMQKLARATASRTAPVLLSEGETFALRLSDAPASVLAAQFATRGGGQQFVDENADWLAIAGRHLARALEAEELGLALQRLRRSELLQRSLFAISDLAGSDLDMNDVLRGIHEIVGTLMYAENCFIVRHDPERDALRFLYYVDTEDPLPPGDYHEFPMKQLERSLTWYLMRDGKALMGNTPRLLKQVSGPLAIIGPEGYDWLGVPMMRDGHARGAVVVQSYREDIGYTDDDKALLEFVADHILTAIERKQGQSDLEQQVRARTSELAQANAVLQQEIVERQRAERLQRALFEIAKLATADISQGEFYRSVHAIVGELLYAENFFIGLVSDDGHLLEFPYYVDGTRRDQASRPLGRGLSEYVLRHRAPLRGMTQDIYDLAAHGEIALQTAGAPAVCWLGVPLFGEDRAIGLIVVQSYKADIVYGPADEELLSFVASQVANSLQRRRAAQSLREAYDQLEQRVLERTRELTATLNQLRETQDELVRQEKLASLGGLVAGIAHEINTPLGICVTAISHVHGELAHWRNWHMSGTFDDRRMAEMLDELEMTVRVIESNIRRGADLVRSFKQIAVDQSSGQRRTFDLAAYLDEIVLSLKPKLKLAPCTVHVECPTGIVMNSFPGAISQIVTNLIVNSILHAFEGRSGGNVRVQAQAEGEDVVLTVSDDGNGMPEADLKRIFDPFFTTKRGSGGTGLGAHIVFNQVTNVLGGTIRVTSGPGEGVRTQMRLPRMLAGKAVE